jgi:hypothetical protein
MSSERFPSVSAVMSQRSQGVRRRALLALEAGRVISTDRLVDRLWPDELLQNATQALYNHISRLRGHPGARRSAGAVGERIRLHLEEDELDADAARWRRTGQSTQLWTTARNATGLLARLDHPLTAALLLMCADDAPEAAAVGPEVQGGPGGVDLPQDPLP